MVNNKTPKPLPPFPAAGGSYLLDEQAWEWVLRDESTPIIESVTNSTSNPKD